MCTPGTWAGPQPNSCQDGHHLSAVQEVDLLLLQWDLACLKLEKAEADFERSKQKRRPTFRMRCCGCTGERASMLATGGHAAFLGRPIHHVSQGS